MDVILYLSWQSSYQSIDGILKHFTPVWKKSGLETISLDLGDPDFKAKLQNLIKERKISFVFCTAGAGAYIESNEGPIWEFLKIPVYSLLLDHPAYLARAHQAQPKNVVLGYMFKDHALYQSKHVKAQNIVTHIDYGIPDLPVRAVGDILRSPPRLIFAKTGNDPARLAANWRQAPQIEAILHDVLDELALTRYGHGNAAAFPPVIRKVAAAHRLELQNFDLLSRYLISQIDDYIRRIKSTAIATALLPFDVDIFGRSWEHIDQTGARARFHGPVPYDKLEAAFTQTAGSVTMNPNIDYSAHDRFFSAIGAGIVPISDHNHYTAENFPELLPYCYDFKPGSITAALERFFANPVLALETVQASRAWRRPQHGIERTAAAILQSVQTLRYLHYTPKPDQNFFVP